MKNWQFTFLCGAIGGFVFKGLCDAVRHRHQAAAGPQRIRTAGRREMEDPPRDWDIVDEQGDESFPASDPPANY